MSMECFPASLPLSVSFFSVLTILTVEFFYFHALIYYEVLVFLKSVGNGAVSLFFLSLSLVSRKGIVFWMLIFVS